MILHRCPWCGEKNLFHSPIKGIWRLAEPDVCPACQKLYTSSVSRSSTIPMIITMAGVYIIVFILKKINANETLYKLFGIAGLILLALVFIEIYRTPHARYIKKEERLTVASKHTADVQLFWNKHQEKGLLLPRFRVLDGEIFPACFMDADGAPISAAFCVVLKDLVWSDNYHCDCKIQFVLDAAPEEKLFQKGNQLYLYYNYRKIASGTIQ